MVALDLKDGKIIYGLDLNSRQSASQIGRKIGASKEVVNYRITKLLQKGIIRYFYTVLNTPALGYTHYKIYFKLQSVDPALEEKMIGYFVKNKNCIWVGICSGNWDLAVSLLAKDSSEFSTLYQKIASDYGQYILEKNILIVDKAPTFSRAHLLDKGMPFEFEYSAKEEKEELDSVDKKILSSLATDGRTNIVDLAESLALTRDSVSYRMKKLQRKGIIQGFRAALDLEKLGLRYYKVLFTFKNSTPEKEKNLISYCKHHKNVVQYIKLIGNWDAEIEFEVENDVKLRDTLLSLRAAFSDIIRNTEHLLVYEKKLNYYPFNP